MLELAAVSYAYDQAAVVRDVSATASPGEFLCVVGPNGAGKTTLLRLIAGLLAPSSGAVRVFGTETGKWRRRDLARRLTYVPQEYRLAFPFRVSEVVLMGRYAHSSSLFGFESQADIAAATAAMEQCDIGDLADRRWGELSGGEQRRALLAQAFCQRAELLLLDEPTAALDPAHAIAVFEAVRARCRDDRVTAIAITHDLNLAARFSDRVLLLHRGAVAAVGAPTDVFRSPEVSQAFSIAMHVGQLPDSGASFVVPG